MKMFYSFVLSLLVASAQATSFQQRDSLQADTLHTFSDNLPVQSPNPRGCVLAEKIPEFPGGRAVLKQWLIKHVRYPKEAYRRGIEGTVYVSFSIATNGEISHARVVCSVHPLLNREALRVVRSMPRWIPGTYYGKKEPMRFVLPVAFRLK